MRWGGISLAAVLLLAVALAAASREQRHIVPSVGIGVEGVTSVLMRHAGQSEAPLRFEDVTEKMGIRFRHFPGVRASLIAEDMGSGVAWGDYDADGFIDLFCVNAVGSVEPGAAHDTETGRSRLYRNVEGMRFDDVTDQAGIQFAGFGMGACWADYDNDQDLDLYVTAFGANILYENQGDGTFRDVTDRCGVQEARFSSGCAWADYDRDGDIDLYVADYVEFARREGDRVWRDPQYSEQPYTINPSAYPPSRNSLFQNNGDGTFSEVAAEAGVADPNGRSLSASWVDMDNDGWQDLYVANDISWNGVFRNRGDGTFEEIGASSLAADYRSGMGLAVADYDNDLDQDIFITHWIAQENALYRNMVSDMSRGDRQGDLWFVDSADALGLGQIALDMVGWATSFCDFDNDGWRDLWMVNGHTFERPDDHRLLIPQPPFLFWNKGEDKGFVEVAGRSCPRLAEPFVGRGGAHADFDRDGLVDLAWQAYQGQLLLLKNTCSSSHHFLRVDLRQTGGNTLALGARVYVAAGGTTHMGEVGCSSSYLSQDERTLHFGLGAAERVESVRIVWPDQAEETHTDLPADRTVTFSHPAAYGANRTGAALPKTGIDRDGN